VFPIAVIAATAVLAHGLKIFRFFLEQFLRHRLAMA
jgi:hypothetical protein